MLRLLDRAARPGAVDCRAEREPWPEDDFCEAHHSVRPVDDSLSFHLAPQKLDARRPCHPAQGEQEARLDRRQQQVLGTPRVSGPIELEGRGRAELGQTIGGEGGMACRTPSEANRVAVGQRSHRPTPCASASCPDTLGGATVRTGHGPVWIT